MLNGFATPSRIFGLAFRLKKSGEKKSGIFLNVLQSWRGVRNYPLLRYLVLVQWRTRTNTIYVENLFNFRDGKFLYLINLDEPWWKKSSQLILFSVFFPHSENTFLSVFYYRKTYTLVSNQVCKPGFCIRRRSGTHVIPTLARSK